MPSLPHSRTHHPHPSSQVPNGPPAKPKSLVASTQLSPPASSLPTHPGQTPTGCRGCFPSKAKKNTLPASAGRSLGCPQARPLQEDKGRAGRVGSVRLGAEVSQEHKQPHAPRDGGPRCLESGRPQEVLPLTQVPRRRSWGGGGPHSPRAKAQACTGEGGDPSAVSLCSRACCHLGLTSVFFPGPFQLDLGEPSGCPSSQKQGHPHFLWPRPLLQL